jgi:hypothetical protein
MREDPAFVGQTPDGRRPTRGDSSHWPILTLISGPFVGAIACARGLQRSCRMHGGKEPGSSNPNAKDQKMTTRATLHWILSAVTTLGLSACSPGGAPIDEKAVTQQAALSVEATIHEAGPALAFTVSDGGTVKKFMGSTTSTANTAVAPAASSGPPSMMSAASTVMPTAMLRAMVGPSVTSQLTGTAMPTLMTTEEQFDKAGSEVKRLMTERLFVDSNFEGKTNDTATYLLHPDPTCRPLSRDTDPPGYLPPVGVACQDDFTKIQVRIAVTADGDGSRMTILVGPDRLELIALVIHSDEIAFEIDLPMAKAAADHIHQQLNDDSPTGSYDRLAGRIRTSLKRVGVQKVTASLSILDAVVVSVHDGAELTSAAANPLMALTGDGVTKSADFQLGLGATDIGSTWNPQGTSPPNRDFHMVVGGLYGKFSLDDNSRQVLLTDVGIGEWKITVRGSAILDLNLNTDTMRRFSGKLTVDSAGVSRLEIAPKVDLSLAFDYNAIGGDFSSPPPVELAHETYGIKLINGGTASVIEEVKSTPAFGGGIRIIAGTLTLAAAGAPAETVIATAGKCLTTRSPAPTGSNPVLGKLVAVECP